jgi:hypothetical protein
MSKQFNSALMFCSVIAIALAVHHAETDPRTDAHPTRALASVESTHKEQILGAFKVPSAVAHTDKLRGPLAVHLEKMNGSASDTVTLRGIISSKQDMSEVEFTWSIPEGLEVVNGQLTGSISALAAHKPTELMVTLHKLKPGTNLQVHLLASARQNGMHFADTAQYNSEWQEALDARKELVQKKTTAATPPAQQEIKIFH